MNKNTLWTIAAVVVLAAAAWLAVTFSSKSIVAPVEGTATTTVPAGTSTPAVQGTKSAPQTYDAEIDLSSIKNLQDAEEALGRHAENNHFYKMVWKNISEIDTPIGPFYFGFLEKQNGDGTTDHTPQPMFLLNGVLYMSGGYGGDTYPLSETGWEWRYKRLSMTGYVRAENIDNMDQEVVSMNTLQAGIISIDANAQKDGTLTHIEITKGEDIYKFDGPFKKIGPVELTVKSQFAGAPDYNGYLEQYRKPAGITSGAASYTANTGFHVLYPEYVNGIKVTRISEDQYSDSFRLSDDPSVNDLAYLYCTPFNPDIQQAGPKKGDLVPVALDSRSKVFDWGYQKEYHSERYSFSGGGFYCQFSTNETFRPDMFSISLP